LLVKLKYNRDHICGLNWVTNYMSKDLKYTTWSSVFFCIHQSHKKRTAPIRGLLSGHHVQEAIEALQIAFKWKIPFLLHAGRFSFIQTPQNGAVVLTGLSGFGKGSVEAEDILANTYRHLCMLCIGHQIGTTKSWVLWCNLTLCFEWN
jgi:hypothetical protein